MVSSSGLITIVVMTLFTHISKTVLMVLLDKHPHTSFFVTCHVVFVCRMSAMVNEPAVIVVEPKVENEIGWTAGLRFQIS